MTPEEAIQQSLQTVAGMNNQFEDPPPMAEMPRGQGAPAGYAQANPNMAVPIGTNDQTQSQILDVLKTLLERVGTLAILAERAVQPQTSVQQQQATATVQAVQQAQPTPAEREQGVDDFKKLTGKDIRKVADPMAALKQITEDRQDEAKQELDEKLKGGSLTPQQHKEQLAKSNKQIQRKTRDQAERGVLNQEIQQAQIDAVNTEIDMAAGKKGVADSKVEAIKQNLGISQQAPQQSTQQQGGGDTAKLVKQVGDQNATLLQKLLQEKKLTDDELNKQSQMLQQIQQNLQTLMDQAEAQRQRQQKAGGR